MTGIFDPKFFDWHVYDTPRYAATGTATITFTATASGQHGAEQPPILVPIYGGRFRRQPPEPRVGEGFAILELEAHARGQHARAGYAAAATVLQLRIRAAVGVAGRGEAVLTAPQLTARGEHDQLAPDEIAFVLALAA